MNNDLLNMNDDLLNMNVKLLNMNIPLISRVRGPYGKLWTEFFPSFYGPSAKEGKNEDP